LELTTVRFDQIAECMLIAAACGDDQRRLKQWIQSHTSYIATAHMWIACSLHHSAGLLPIGRFGGPSPPRNDLLVRLFACFAGEKPHQKKIFSRACGPRSPTGE